MESSKQRVEVNAVHIATMLWRGKFYVLLCVLISLLCAGVIWRLSPETSEARLRCYQVNVPAFLPDSRAHMDFENNFFSSRNFTQWKQANPSSIVTYEDIDKTGTVNGVRIAKTDANRLVVIETEADGNWSLVLKTGDLELINDIYSYANFINAMLGVIYSELVEKEISTIEQLGILNNMRGESHQTLFAFLDHKRFMRAIEVGILPMDIGRPERRQNASLPTMLSWGGVFGIVFGSLLVVLSALYRTFVRPD